MKKYLKKIPFVTIFISFLLLICFIAQHVISLEFYTFSNINTQNLAHSTLRVFGHSDRVHFIGNILSFLMFSSLLELYWDELLIPEYLETKYRDIIAIIVIINILSFYLVWNNSIGFSLSIYALLGITIIIVTFLAMEELELHMTLIMIPLLWISILALVYKDIMIGLEVVPLDEASKYPLIPKLPDQYLIESARLHTFGFLLGSGIAAYYSFKID